MSATTVVDPLLLEILRCPESRQKLAPAPDALVARLNAARAAGSLRTVSGETVAVDLPIDAALVREDGARAYLVVEGIPRMLAEKAVAPADLPEVA